MQGFIGEEGGFKGKAKFHIEPVKLDEGGGDKVLSSEQWKFSP